VKLGGARYELSVIGHLLADTLVERGGTRGEGAAGRVERADEPQLLADSRVIPAASWKDRPAGRVMEEGCPTFAACRGVEVP
jgi:hypothetical protein